MRKTIVEDMWPHGTRTRTIESSGALQEIDDAAIQKFLRGVALAAKTAGMLDDPDSHKAVIKVLKKVVSQPADLARELRKMSKSGSRATSAFRQIRKDL